MKSSLLPTDTYLSTVFLSNTLEYALVSVFFIAGLTVGFATHMDKFLLSAPYSALHVSCHGDIRSFQPSVFYAIMPLWTLIHKFILQDIFSRSPQFQEKFWLWLGRKKRLIDSSLDFTRAMKVVDRKGGFDSIRNKFLGSRIRWIANTCSMMPKERREFLGLVLGGPSGQMVDGWISMEINWYVRETCCFGVH